MEKTLQFRSSIAVPSGAIAAVGSIISLAFPSSAKAADPARESCDYLMGANSTWYTENNNHVLGCVMTYGNMSTEEAWENYYTESQSHRQMEGFWPDVTYRWEEAGGVLCERTVYTNVNGGLIDALLCYSGTPPEGFVDRHYDPIEQWDELQGTEGYAGGDGGAGYYPC